MSMTISINPTVEIDITAGKMSEAQFLDFCAENPELQIEQDQYQNVIIMPPVYGESGYFENEASGEVRNYAKSTKKGVSFSPNTGFKLPNGATRVPDANWISNERWSKLTPEDKKKFLRVAPDFIVEVRSETDRLKTVKAKMREWIENGVRLAWLIDPKTKTTHIYRENGSIEIVEGFEKVLSGEDVMPGFEFDLKLLRMP